MSNTFQIKLPQASHVKADLAQGFGGQLPQEKRGGMIDRVEQAGRTQII